MSASKTLERISARVFCHAGSKGGGNPVTVFSSTFPILAEVQTELAKSCEWESVIVTVDNEIVDMDFYMPSGEQVSFCAHAALGGAFAVGSQPPSAEARIATKVLGSPTGDEIRFQSKKLSKEQIHTIRISSSSNDVSSSSAAAEDCHAGLACLHMSAKYEQSPVSHPPTLARILRSHLGLGSEHSVPRVGGGGRRFPSSMNASVARPKTLVYVNSIEALNGARQPKVFLEEPQQRNSFAAACGAIDDSTGIYLYTNKPDEKDAWECRQFPRASGYPEDPATGIAAAALAAALYRDGIYLPVYKFYQGTAMERPSLIEVLDLQLRGQEANFSLQGRVEIDNRETITI